MQPPTSATSTALLRSVTTWSVGWPTNAKLSQHNSKTG
jgi:hypothetical protein